MNIIAKILCCGAIGNYFVGNSLYAQSLLEERHIPFTGLNRMIQCGSLHPCLGMHDSLKHMGLAIQPSHWGLGELARIGICADIVKDSLIAAHARADLLSFGEFALMNLDCSLAWHGFALPITPGCSLQTEVVNIGGGFQQLTYASISSGALIDIDNALDIGILLRQTIISRNEDFGPTHQLSTFTIGCGYAPLEELSLGMDMVILPHSSGLRAGFAWNYTDRIQALMSLSMPYASGMFGLHMDIDDIFVEVETFYHLYLGYSWQFAFQYRP